MLTFSSNYDRKAFDAEGHPLHHGDQVTPAQYPGPAHEAPVYQLALICTDSSTLLLRRADGSHLYRQAHELRHLSPQ